MKAELQRRLSYAKQLEWYLRAHPGEWIPIAELAKLGGVGGWRTRLSELGRRADDPLHIEHNGQNGELSAHRYLPFEPLGRDPQTPAPQLEKHPPVPQTLF